MLGSVPITSSPTMQTDNSNAHSSPRSTGRLRGLSYLRSYSQGTDLRTDSEPTSRRATGPAHSNRLATALVTEEDPAPSSSRHTRARDPARVRRAASTTASEAHTGGWLPSVDGSPGLARPTTQLQPSPATPRRSRRPPTTAGGSAEEQSTMTRNRSATSPHHISPAPVDLSALRSARRTSTPATSNPSNSQLPSIQLIAYQDPRSARPSLNFQTTTRTLPDQNSIIKVGRYSERDAADPTRQADMLSDAPVGFKSKVVSRRHCEFFYSGTQWFIKDVKSSSGTFLNHIRLSPPGVESRPYSIKDGDLVQLGIDFKGGEEMIFRCVKTRVLLNRGWQKSLNKFNKSAHKRLNDLQKSMSKDVEANKSNSTECTICLNSIAPCQSLFVAPCSHTWHYKCIRPMLEQTSRMVTDDNEMQFICPNCRNVADLEADIDEGPLWEESEEDEMEEEEEAEDDHLGDGDVLETHGPPTDENGDVSRLRMDDIRLEDDDLDGPTRPPRRPSLNRDATDFVPASPLAARKKVKGSSRATDSPSESTSEGSDNGVRVSRSVPLDIDSHLHQTPPPPEGDTEGPLTPRNNAGPFVFDGGAGASTIGAAASTQSLTQPKTVYQTGHGDEE